jgi:outer membrane protein assembly factor BamD (BamD/ComL family)
MRRWTLLTASMMLVACSTSSRVPWTSPLEAHRLVHQADTQLRAGNPAAAVRILDDVVRRFPDASNHDEALYHLARALVLSASGGREYRQAAAYLDRLLREHPTSAYAVDARALRLALGAYATRAAENDRLLERLKAIDLEFDRPRQP